MTLSDPESLLLRDMSPCQKARTGLEGPRSLGPGRRDQHAGCSLNPVPASAPVTHCVHLSDSLSAWAGLTLTPAPVSYAHPGLGHRQPATRCLGLLVACVGWGARGAPAAQPVA